VTASSSTTRHASASTSKAIAAWLLDEAGRDEGQHSQLGAAPRSSECMTAQYPSRGGFPVLHDEIYFVIRYRYSYYVYVLRSE